MLNQSGMLVAYRAKDLVVLSKRMVDLDEVLIVVNRVRSRITVVDAAYRVGQVVLGMRKVIEKALAVGEIRFCGMMFPGKGVGFAGSDSGSKS